MKHLNKIFFLIVLSTIILSASSCKKYEDGPRISLRSKKDRVANTWTVDRAFSNGVEMSSTQVQTYKTLYFNSIEFTKGGNVVLITTYGTFTGTWEFQDSKVNIQATMTGTIPGTSSSTTVTEDFKILRLKEKQLWLEFFDDVNGDTKTVYLIPA